MIGNGRNFVDHSLLISLFLAFILIVGVGAQDRGPDSCYQCNSYDTPALTRTIPHCSDPKKWTVQKCNRSSSVPKDSTIRCFTGYNPDKSQIMKKECREVERRLLDHVDTNNCQQPDVTQCFCNSNNCNGPDSSKHPLPSKSSKPSRSVVAPQGRSLSGGWGEDRFEYQELHCYSCFYCRNPSEWQVDKCVWQHGHWPEGSTVPACVTRYTYNDSEIVVELKGCEFIRPEEQSEKYRLDCYINGVCYCNTNQCNDQFRHPFFGPRYGKGTELPPYETTTYKFGLPHDGAKQCYSCQLDECYDRKLWRIDQCNYEREAKGKKWMCYTEYADSETDQTNVNEKGCYHAPRNTPVGGNDCAVINQKICFCEGDLCNDHPICFIDDRKPDNSGYGQFSTWGPSTWPWYG